MSTTTTAKRGVPSRKKTALPGPESWDDWVAYLGRRKSPRPLDEWLGDQRTSALAWPLCPGFPGSESEQLVASLARPKSRGRANRPAARPLEARQLEAWLEAAPARELEPLLAIESLAWAHALPRLAEMLPAAPWCQLLDELIAISSRAKELDLIADPLAHQLLCGELPLTLAYQLPELEATRAGGAAASETLSAAIAEVLDGEGLLGSRHYELMRPLLACWTRCVCMGRAANLEALDPPANTQYALLVREALRFSRADGSQPLVDPAVGIAPPSLWRAALGAIDSDVERNIAAMILPASAVGGRKPAGVKPASRKSKSTAGKPSAKVPALPASAVHSGWAETSMLRREWKRDATSLAITYGDRQVAFELNGRGETAWSGSWSFDVRADGRRLEPDDDYTEVCWVSDEDVDYLELEMTLQGGWRLQRQMLLARDGFLFLADALLGERMQTVEYLGTLPLCPDMRFEPAEETCEGVIAGRRFAARVLPIDLQEWRTQSTGDALRATSGGLELRLGRRTSRMFAALFIDLDPRRRSKEPTWRQLTVAQRLERQSDDVAVGYRVQIGKDQWLVYRSLAPKTNRTVLGQNYNTDFVMARFKADGEAEKLLEIE